MQFQVEARQALHRLVQKLPGVVAALESNNYVVGEADYDYFPTPLLSPPLVGPHAPCLCFACTLTDACARLGADVVRYTFIL